MCEEKMLVQTPQPPSQTLCVYLFCWEGEAQRSVEATRGDPNFNKHFVSRRWSVQARNRQSRTTSSCGSRMGITNTKKKK